MTPAGVCQSCARRFTGWALEQNLTCPKCGGRIKLEEKMKMFKVTRKHANDNYQHLFYVIANSFGEAEVLVKEYEPDIEIGQIDTMPGIVLINKGLE